MEKIVKPKQDMSPVKLKTIYGLILFWPLGVYLTLKYRSHWFKKTSFIIMFILYAYFTSWITASIIMAPSEMAKGEKYWLETVAIEEGRKYEVTVENLDTTEKGEVSGVLTFDCNLQKTTVTNSEDKYSGQSDNLRCTDNFIKGKYSHYESTSLNNDGFGDEMEVKDDLYTLKLKLDSFTKNDWEKDALDFSALQEEGIKKIVKLSVVNKVLDSAVMVEKVVSVKYYFTDDDIALLATKNDGYKAYVKAESERKAKEEAEQKAQEEAKKAEQERQRQAEQNRSIAPPTQSTPPTPSTPPAENSNLPLKAICKDGTVSYQDTPSNPNYRGMCSGHGGIKTKLGRVP